MRILYFLDYGMQYGGAAHTLLQQASVMKDAGHDVGVFVSDYYGNEIWDEYRERLNEARITAERACFFLSSEPEDIDVVNIHEEYDRIISILEDKCPNIVHSVQLNPVVELACRELGIPHVMSIYVLSPDFFCYDYINVFPRYLVCDSEYCARQWREYVDLRYACIRTMVKPSAIEQHKLSDSLRCICVGSVYKGKNQLEVIKGFHRALEQGFKGSLELYGYAFGPYAEECNRYIREAGLENVIKICGFCSDMAAVYSSSDLLICGSTRESYPNAISEAMAYGLIVLSTPVGGVPEIIRDSVNGFLTRGYDKEDICEKLIECQTYCLKKSINDLLQRSLETAQREHHPNIIRKKLEKFYLAIMSETNTDTNVALPDVGVIRDRYMPLIRHYYGDKHKYSDARLVAGKLWYLGYAQPAIERANQSGRSFYLWGAGKLGKSVVEIMKSFFPDVHISGVIDSYATGTYVGYRVFKPEDIINEDAVIIISLGNGQWDVVKFLKNHEKKIGEDYFVLAPRTW